MDGPRAPRLVEAVLRCYPAGWRRRHGDEAAELAALLIRDGRAPGAVAWSYLAGAAREWLTPRPGRLLGPAACALLVAACTLAVPAGLLAAAGPARAGTGQARARAQCPPGPPGAFPGVLPATGHPLVIIRAARHDQSC
jgi:hypothetical protein